MNRSFLNILLGAGLLFVMAIAGESLYGGTTRTSRTPVPVVTDPAQVTPPPINPDYRTDYIPQ